MSKSETKSPVCKSIYQVQSRILTLAKRDTTPLEENIIIKLVSVAQEQIKGLGLKDINGFQMNLWGDVRLDIKLSDLSGKNMYKDYLRAFESLTHKTIVYDDGDTILIIPFFQMVKYIKRSAIVTIQVSKEVWDCILNFSKYADLYNVSIAMKLPTAYAKRFYEMISHNKRPITYLLKDLNRFFSSNYEAKDFRKYVLEPTKKYLDSMADYTFDFNPYPSPDEWKKLKKVGRRPVLGWTFTPIKIHTTQSDKLDLDYRVNHTNFNRIPKIVIDWLINNMDFDNHGINSNDDKIYKSLEILGSNWEFEFDDIKVTMAKQRKEIKSRPAYFLKLLTNRINQLTNPNINQLNKDIESISKNLSLNN